LVLRIEIGRDRDGRHDDDDGEDGQKKALPRR
jgi:hypothetical protein